MHDAGGAGAQRSIHVQRLDILDFAFFFFGDFGVWHPWEECSIGRQLQRSGEHHEEGG